MLSLPTLRTLTPSRPHRAQPVDGAAEAARRASPNLSLSCTGVIAALLHLASQPGLHERAKAQLDRARAHCPQVLVVNLAGVPSSWHSLREDLLCELLPGYVRGERANARVVLQRVWETNRAVLLLHLLREGERESGRIPHIVHTALRLQDGLPALLSVEGHHGVRSAIALHALTAKPGAFNVRQWVQHVVSSSSDVVSFSSAYLGALEHALTAPQLPVPDDERKRRDAMLVMINALRAVEGAVPESLQGRLDSLNVRLGGQRPVSSSSSSHQSQPAPVQEPPHQQQQQQQPSAQSPARARDGHDARSVAPGSAVDSDIEAQANSYFQQIYTGQRSIEEVVDMLRGFNTSDSPRDQQVFSCMIHNLFDEYRFFNRYPAKELRITGVMFGALIRHQLVSSITLAIALRYVLDALRSHPPGSKMFVFGLHALEQFKERVPEWPPYALAVIGLDPLREQRPDLVQEIQTALRTPVDPSAVSASATSAAANAHAGRGLTAASTATTVASADSGFGDAAVAAAAAAATAAANTPINQSAMAAAAASAAKNPVAAGLVPREMSAVETGAGQPGTSAAAPVVEDPVSSSTQPNGSLARWGTGGMGGGLGGRPSRNPSQDASHDTSPSLQGQVGPMPGAQGAAGGFGEDRLLSSVDDAARGGGQAGAGTPSSDPLGGPGAPITAALDGGSAVEELPITEPPTAVVSAVRVVSNNMTESNVEDKAGELKSRVEPEHRGWLANYMVQDRVGAHPNQHDVLLRACKEAGGDEVIALTLHASLRRARELLLSKSIRTAVQERTQLKNLGRWIGKVTLERDKPLLHDDLNVKELLWCAYESGFLITVMPFVAKVLEGGARSTVFRPPNPWMMAMLASMREIYDVPGLKLNLKFELEVLCRSLGVAVSDLRRVRHLAARFKPVLEGNPDWSLRDQDAQTARDSMPGTVRRVAADSASSLANARTIIPGLEKYVAIHQPEVQAFFARHPRLRPAVAVAVDRAIYDIIQPLAERSVTIAATTTSELVVKDMSMESDEARLREAAHSMVRSLASRLALVTCKDPLRNAIASNMRNLISSAVAESESSAMETAVQRCAEDNVPLGAILIQRRATEKAVEEVDRKLASAYAVRRRSREQGQAYYDPSGLVPGSFLSALPEALRPTSSANTALYARQRSVYQAFPSAAQAPSAAGSASTAAPLAASSASSSATTSAAAAGAGAGSASSAAPPASGAVASVTAAPTSAAMPPSSLPATASASLSTPAASVATARPGQASGGAPAATGVPGQATDADPTSTITPAQVSEQLGALTQRLGEEVLAAGDSGRGQPIELLPSGHPVATTLRQVKEVAALAAARGGDAVAAVWDIARRVLHQLYVLPRPAKRLDVDALCGVLLALSTTQADLPSRVTELVFTRTGEQRYNAEVAAALLRSGMLRRDQYDAHLAQLAVASTRGVADANVLAFGAAVVRALVMDRAASAPEFPAVVRMLREVAAGERMVSDPAFPGTAERILAQLDSAPAPRPPGACGPAAVLGRARGGSQGPSRNGPVAAGRTPSPAAALPGGGAAPARTMSTEAGDGGAPTLPDDKTVGVAGVQEAMAGVVAAAETKGPIGLAHSDPAGTRTAAAQLLDAWIEASRQALAAARAPRPGGEGEGGAEGADGSGGQSPSAAADAVHTKYLALLRQQGVLQTDASSERFFRVTACLAMERALAPVEVNAPLAQAKLDMTHVDAFARLVQVLMRFMDPSKPDARPRLLALVLRVVASVLAEDAAQKRRAGVAWDQRPAYRLLLGLVRAVVEVQRRDPVGMLLLVAQSLHSVRPTVVPAFAFSWLELSAHREVMARLLAAETQSAWAAAHQLLLDGIDFVAPLVARANPAPGSGIPAAEGEALSPSVRALYAGLLRVMLVLLHDFPDFVAAHHVTLVDAVPPQCIQLRNLVLAASPRAVVLPDPFAADLKVDMLPETAQAPRMQADVAAPLDAVGLREELDAFLARRGAPGFLDSLPPRLTFGEDASSRAMAQRAGCGAVNAPLLHALVLYVGSRQVAAKAAGAGKEQLGAHTDVVVGLCRRLEPEGRYVLLNAVANQLRYPNSHTHVFSCLLLYLFREGGPDVREQVARVLLERLLVHRPQPWGLLITFIELVKNPRYDFWANPFVRINPDVERLFASVSRACTGETAAGAAGAGSAAAALPRDGSSVGPAGGAGAAAGGAAAPAAAGLGPADGHGATLSPDLAARLTAAAQRHTGEVLVLELLQRGGKPAVATSSNPRALWSILSERRGVPAHRGTMRECFAAEPAALRTLSEGQAAWLDTMPVKSDQDWLLCAVQVRVDNVLWPVVFRYPADPFLRNIGLRGAAVQNGRLVAVGRRYPSGRGGRSGRR